MGKSKMKRIDPSADDALSALRRVYAEHFERVRREQRQRRALSRRRWKGEGLNA